MHCFVYFFAQICPDTIFLEEDVTKHAEFPSNGIFNLNAHGCKYKVCGEPQLPEAPAPPPPPEPSRPPYQPSTSASGWGTPRPWQAQVPRAEPMRSVARPKYETSIFKRSIPFVTLCPDQSSRNLTVDTYISNLYLKMPESEVSLDGILAAASPKVDLPVEQLVLLDSSFLPVTGGDKCDFLPPL